MKPFKLIAGSVLLAIVTGLIACGGGGGGDLTAGIGGTGKIASGTITKFGSIFVNGVEYDIDSATCSVDDNDVTGNCQANLALGMVVTVEGTVAGTTGIASRVVFDADAEGPVAGLTTGADGLTKTFSILGISVAVDKASTLFDDNSPGFNFDTLANDNVVEVSGFFDAGGTLQATYIEKKSDSVVIGTTAVERKGIATNVTGNGGPGDSLTLDGFTVNLLADVDLSDMPGNRVSNGDFIEAKGVLTGASSMDANRVEPEEQSVGSDGDEISVEGLVSNFNGDLSNFEVAGRTVDASGATLEPATLQLSNGLKVEVEGSLNGTTLVAEIIEQRGNNLKIDAAISALTANTLTVQLGNSGSITVSVNNQTKIEDSTDVVENPDLSDFNSGDFVQIRGFEDATGVTASEIQRSSADDVTLQGPVDSFVSNTSITILGVTFFTNGGTQFEDSNDSGITSAAFYSAVSPGDIVKIKDDQPGDGTADEVDQEN
jgi:hypothetical protein